MEDSKSKNTFYECMNTKQLVDIAIEEIHRFDSDDKVYGSLTVKSTYPKAFRDRIDTLGLVLENLKSKIYKEGDKHNPI